MFKSSTRIALTALVAGLLGSVATAGVIAYLASVGVIQSSGLGGAQVLRGVVDLMEENGMRAHVVGGDRPAVLAVPKGRSSKTLTPLLLLLHGYGDDGLALLTFYDFAMRAEEGGFAILVANGARDEEGNRYWNATDLCCGKADVKPEDVSYLVGLVEEAGTLVAVDRTYVLGHSNGGFMAYRLACENMAGLAGIVSIAGSEFEDVDRCAGSNPVSVLQVHGDRDGVVRIDGGVMPALGAGRYPGSAQVTERWAERAGCDSGAETPVAFRIGDLVHSPWVQVWRYREGCEEGVTVEFWEVSGAGHIISGSYFVDRVLDWLLAQGTSDVERYVS